MEDGLLGTRMQSYVQNGAEGRSSLQPTTICPRDE